MIVMMNRACRQDDIDQVVGLLTNLGASPRLIRGPDRACIEVTSVDCAFDPRRLNGIPMVEEVCANVGSVLATDRQRDDRPLEITLFNGAVIGGKRIALIAGPCSVESRSQLLRTAEAARDAGAVALRGGAFKPRTSPYSFQGLGEEALELLAEARQLTGLAVVTEVLSSDHLPIVAKYADVLQVGSRNMHNSHLLTALGRQNKPVLLKRGWSATLEELLLAAEYILQAGNPNVILCERGIRTHEDYVRNTLALAIVPEIKRQSRLPILVDPSHGTGRRHLVAPMSRAAIACGADGLLIEIHPNPNRAWTDGEQTLDLEAFHALAVDVRGIAEACGREM